MANEKILVVDDEVNILELVKFNLAGSGFKPAAAESGEEALEILKNDQIDLVILDVMLPGIDGWEVLRRIKSEPALNRMPIIMLTAKNAEIDKVVGLEIGADDYVTKPFSTRELVARVKALLRRSVEPKDNDQDDEILKAADLVIDLSEYKVSRNGVRLDFTLKEFELLRILVQNEGKVLTRDVLLDKIWGYDYFGETRTVDVHIRHLRKKLESEGIEYIETIRGVGYKFEYRNTLRK